MNISDRIVLLMTGKKPCTISHKAGRIVIIQSEDGLVKQKDYPEYPVLTVKQGFMGLENKSATVVWQCISRDNVASYWCP